MSDNPYTAVPPRGFWRTGVAEAGLFGLSGLWASKWTLPADARFATFGSCFAQHISRALVARGLGWLEAEAPPRRTPAEIARKYNYGVFSARTGNIYTSGQLLAWVRLATGAADPAEVELWTDGRGRVHDLLRPAIEPRGFGSAPEARASLGAAAHAFGRCLREADVLVFTMGLTEGWRPAQGGMPYTLCPGTGVGTFDPARHRFHNAAYPEIRAEMEEAIARMRAVNPGLRLLLTVSPVPLVATASGDHVLVATQYSKSVLRAVAGDLAAAEAGTDYFPSYEIIASPPARATFFEPNLRGVAQAGVDLVMGHFFAGLDLSGPARGAGGGGAEARAAHAEARLAQEDLVCEELTLERFNDA